MVDEWQLEPQLWDLARTLIDERLDTAQFIFTGSVVPESQKPFHSGAGRFARLMMRSFSLFESKESSGAVSLKSLFDGESIPTALTSSLSFDDLLWAMTRGGWPASLFLSRKAAARIPKNYLAAIEHADVEFIEDERIAWDEIKIRALLQSLARVSAQSVNLSRTVEDIRSNAGVLTRKTAALYINALKRLFVIVDQPAWSVSLRSRTVLRESPKRHFVDPSLTIAALGASPEKLTRDYSSLGLVFETLCYRDVCVYAQPLNGTLYHYRDQTGLEIDQIIALRDGRWAAIEVKLGDAFLDAAAGNLLNTAAKINTARAGDPSFLAILYAGEVAYRRSDGVFVIPIGCLGP